MIVQCSVYCDFSPILYYHNDYDDDDDDDTVKINWTL